MKWLVLPAMELIFHLAMVIAILIFWQPVSGDLWWWMRCIVLGLCLFSGFKMLRRTL
jgi:hypothetical protein